MPHYHFIVNPIAGGQTCLQRFRGVEASLQRRGVDYSVAYSEHPGHGAELARAALMSGKDCIVAVGGDGTVREVAQELVNGRVPLGIVPMGTGNDMIRSLGIPKDPEQALETLLSGELRWIDTLSVNGRLCLNVAGLGFDVEVLQKTEYYKNSMRGKLAYLLGVLHALVTLRSHRVEITAGKGTLEADILMLIVGNGNYIGGGMMAAPLADPSDSLMDLCIVRRVGRLKVLHCLLRFMRGGHLGMDIVSYSQTDAIEVKSQSPLPIQLDGEILELTPAVFQIAPASLCIAAQPVSKRGFDWRPPQKEMAEAE